MPQATFVLKEPNSKEETLVYMLFRFQKNILKYSTGQKIHPKYWNPAEQKVRETRQFSGYAEFNALLKKLDGRVSEEYRRLVNDGKAPTPELLRDSLNELLHKKTGSYRFDLLSFGKYLLENSNKKPETLANYKQTIRNLEEFKASKRVSLAFDDITLDFYEGFMKFALAKNYSNNTIDGFIKNIKAFMNEAFDRGLHRNLDHKKRRFRRLAEETESIYLAQDEVKKIYHLDLTANPRLAKVRDLFVIGCYTGLRYIDLSQLTEKNLVDKTKFKITTEKTGELVVIPIHPYVGKILAKYGWNLPESLSNQKMNDYLKELGQLAELDTSVSITTSKGGSRVVETSKKYELITVHTARRSFATNAYLMGVPTISIMKITGHRTEKAFLKYIKISQEDNANKLLNHPFFKSTSAV
jgi:site-specific recombinase XerD